MMAANRASSRAEENAEPAGYMAVFSALRGGIEQRERCHHLRGGAQAEERVRGDGRVLLEAAHAERAQLHQLPVPHDGDRRARGPGLPQLLLDEPGDVLLKLLRQGLVLRVRPRSGHEQQDEHTSPRDDSHVLRLLGCRGNARAGGLFPGITMYHSTLSASGDGQRSTSWCAWCPAFR